MTLTRFLLLNVNLISSTRSWVCNNLVKKPLGKQLHKRQFLSKTIGRKTRTFWGYITTLKEATCKESKYLHANCWILLYTWLQLMNFDWQTENHGTKWLYKLHCLLLLRWKHTFMQPEKNLGVSSTTLQRISTPMEAGPEKAVLTFQPSASSRRRSWPCHTDFLGTSHESSWVGLIDFCCLLTIVGFGFFGGLVGSLVCNLSRW